MEFGIAIVIPVYPPHDSKSAKKVPIQGAGSTPVKSPKEVVAVSFYGTIEQSEEREAYCCPIHDPNLIFYVRHLMLRETEKLYKAMM